MLISKLLRAPCLSATMVLMFCCLTGCNSSLSTVTSYDDTIAEGRAAAQQFIDQHKASAISIALVDAKHIIWTQNFGYSDPITGQTLSDTSMIGLGSVSKIFAAMAVMKLVERGAIDIDTPLVSYLPSFKMASVGYKNITARMLLNHSAGFPGTDYRNADIRSPNPDYPDQVLETLSYSRLKAPPGYMNSYCNDCFAVVEALIKARTGKHYVTFLQEEILAPLGMNNTRFPFAPFATGSYAKAIQNGVLKPQEFLNSAAAGGLYSTANDMAKVAMMFLGNGVIQKINGDGSVGTLRILETNSIAEMAKDQTLNSALKPVHSNSWAFGLGWDTVTQPGLLAVKIGGWGKGGDSNDYGAQLIVSPQAGLAVVVLGASGFSSENAKSLAERVLLKALAENHRIPSFPVPLENTVDPNAALTNQIYSTQNGAPEGVYGFSDAVLKFDHAQGELLGDNGWVPDGKPLIALSDGWFVNPDNPLRTFRAVNANLLGFPARYLLSRSPGGYGNYLDSQVFAEAIQDTYPTLSAAWQNRLSNVWLVVNENPDELTWNGMDPRLRFASIPDRAGLIAIRSPMSPTSRQILDPSQSDSIAKMMLIIPQLNGRDLNDLVLIERSGQEWARLGSYMLQPIQSVSQLAQGQSETNIIGSEGYAQWRKIVSTGNPVQISLTTTGAWRLYDATFNTVAHGTGNSVVSLPAGSGPGYLTFFGTAGQVISVDVL